MSESHFLILPSIAECNAVVFAEANSFGLPCLATNVGGIGTSVISGKNGYTFDLSESADRYCDAIEQVMSSEESYRDLARSTFMEYSSRLNWAVAGNEVRTLIEKHASVVPEC
jgi:glycosyltransferase involved in cell wall biosynthesis